MTAIRRFFATLSLGTYIILTASCGTTPVKEVEAENTPLTLENYEQYLEDSDDLSEQEQAQRVIEVADFLISKKQSDSAHKLIDSIAREALASESEIHYLLVQAKIALAEGEPYIAQSYLFNARSEQFIAYTPTQTAIEFYDIRAQVLFDQSDYLESVDQRLKVSPFLAEDELTMQLNHDLIWEALAEIPSNQLYEKAKTERNAVKEGWYSLAALSKSNGANFRQQIVDLEKWREVWPDHPASTLLPADLQLILQLADQQSLNIAVFLPLSGKRAGVGAAIREGIMAGYYDDVSHHSVTPAIEFFDTVDQDVNALYDQAHAKGYELIIGPLDKENVARLSTREFLPIPILALNSFDKNEYQEAYAGNAESELADFTLDDVKSTQAKPDTNIEIATDEPSKGADSEFESAIVSTQQNKPVFYFSLAVESEAQQVARRAWKDGHRRALIIAPLSEWGDRGAQEFANTWSEIGGELVDEKRYKDQRSFSSLIEASVAVDKSLYRKRDLQRLLAANLEFEPRRRKDIDFIFLLAYPKQAKQFLPLLAFHYAGDIPVYATSHVFSEAQNSGLSDLNGLRFSTMPWHFDANITERRAIQAFGDNLTPYQSLYAMGVDAYHIYPRLEQLQLISQAQFYGATGKLRVGADNTIERAQNWAEVKNGVAVELSSGTGLSGEF